MKFLVRSRHVADFFIHWMWSLPDHVSEKSGQERIQSNKYRCTLMQYFVPHLSNVWEDAFFPGSLYQLSHHCRNLILQVCSIRRCPKITLALFFYNNLKMEVELGDENSTFMLDNFVVHLFRQTPKPLKKILSHLYHFNNDIVLFCSLKKRVFPKRALTNLKGNYYFLCQWHDNRTVLLFFFLLVLPWCNFHLVEVDSPNYSHDTSALFSSPEMHNKTANQYSLQMSQFWCWWYSFCCSCLTSVNQVNTFSDIAWVSKSHGFSSFQFSMQIN